MEPFCVTPLANIGLLRILLSRTFNRPIRALVERRFDGFMKSIGVGWTLMARAKKRAVMAGRSQDNPLVV